MRQSAGEKDSSVKLSTLGSLVSEVKTLGEGSFGRDLSWALLRPPLATKSILGFIDSHGVAGVLMSDIKAQEALKSA